MAKAFFDEQFRELHGKIIFNLEVNLSKNTLICEIQAIPFPSPDDVLKIPKLFIEKKPTPDGVEELFAEIVHFFCQYGLLEGHFNTLIYNVQGDASFSKYASRIEITHQYLENNLNEQKNCLLNFEGIKKKKDCIIM